MTRIGKFLLLPAVAILPPAFAWFMSVGVVHATDPGIEAGLVDGRLRPCPPGTDCVTSEGVDLGHQVVPLAFGGDADQAFASLVQFVRLERGAQLLEGAPGYARLLVVTPYLKLADELELRLDQEAGVVHVRALARVDTPAIQSARALVEAIRSRWQRPEEASEGLPGGTDV